MLCFINIWCVQEGNSQDSIKSSHLEIGAQGLTDFTQQDIKPKKI